MATCACLAESFKLSFAGRISSYPSSPDGYDDRDRERDRLMASLVAVTEHATAAEVAFGRLSAAKAERLAAHVREAGFALLAGAVRRGQCYIA